MPLIELKGARAVLEGHPVFESLDFVLQAGKSASIFGPNGAGKTTLLRLLAGELWPVRAESRAFDFGKGPTWSPLGARERIAFVSPHAQERLVRLAQDGADNERGARLSIRECVTTGLFDSVLLNQTPSEKQRGQVETWLERFDLTELAEREVQTLSQGQLRRVILARALVKSPRLVLLDEAASGLDEQSRNELFAQLERLSGEGVTFVFASHRSEELPSWASRWKLANGHLEQQGEVSLALLQEEGEELAPLVTVTSQEEDSVFELRHVSVFLEGHPILRDLNWRWPRGFHLRVRGENGSGKSTFLKLLCGELVPALGGEIERLGEKNPRPIWEWRRRIALVSPHLQARFHDALSVYEAIASGFEGGFLPPRTLEEGQREAIEGALDAWNLRSLAGRRFDRLSFGQTRRVLLARAIVAAPEVVLLDEALDGLDEDTRQFCFRKWRALAAGGTHFAFASHHDADFPAWTNGEMTLVGGEIQSGVG